MPNICYTNAMLNRITALYLEGKTVQQIRGVMTLEHGTRTQVFTDWDIQRQLDKLDDRLSVY